MKKILTLLLASVMLFSALPAALADGETSGVNLSPMSALTINAETGYIENIPELITVNELLTHFENKDDITVTTASGKALELTDTVGTGAVVAAGDSSVKTLVHGDVNSDCKITTSDAIAILQSLAAMDVKMVKEAADVTYDEKMTATDAIQIIRYLAGWDIDLRNHAILDPLTAPSEDSDIELLFDSVMNRVAAENVNPSDDYTYTVKMAKNEIEDVQIFLTSTAKKTGMSLEIGDVTNANGAVLETEKLYGYYYKFDMLNALEGADHTDVTNGRYVDPLPKLVNPFELAANESKSFVVKIKTTPDTEAGLYKSTVNLKDADGNIVKTAEFRVYVWNFALDEETASDTAFGLSRLATNLNDGVPEYVDVEKITQDYIPYYDYLLENRVSAYGMPYYITDPRADEYMSNPRVTSFIVAGSGNGGEYDRTDEYVVEAYEKLRTNEDWHEKAYIYKVDEPWNEEAILSVKEQYEWALGLLPENDFQIVVPLASNNYFPNLGADSVDFMSDYVNIWCPQSYAFKPYVSYSERRDNPDLYPSWMYNSYTWDTPTNFDRYGQFRDRYEEFRERGDKMWWYICCAPEYPHPSFFQSYQGCNIRLVLWQQYMLDIDGLLYWGTTVWDGVTKNRPGTANGDGLLLYPGTLFGQEEGPVTCIRFESVRDGIEDFQYLTQLENLTDRETSMEYVEQITTEVLRFTEDYEEYVRVRDDLGFALEALYNK